MSGWTVWGLDFQPAQVPGGAYTGGPEVTDLGMGLRPDLVGKGHGAAALHALMKEAERDFSLTRFRVTVAAVNHRASAFMQHLGFRARHRFRRPSDGCEFVQYERDAPTDDRHPFKLSTVELDERDVLGVLLGEYLGELSGHRERPADATRANEYTHLDAYFCEPGRRSPGRSDDRRPQAA